VAIITDANVADLYGAAIVEALSDYQTHLIIRPPGESQKSLSNLEEILSSLFEVGFGRSDLVIAFGGGVIGDLAGFAAAIFKRGMPFIQVPTTLLSQVDSSVGGKTAINNDFGKNLIGAFYQPKAVITDTEILSSLPVRELKAGYAEVLKYGLLGDAGFFTELDAGLGADILTLDAAALSRAIYASCAAKAEIVARDEREGGLRALLNLGHTRIADMAHLLTDPAALLRHMGQDKKNEGGHLTLILPRAIGETYIEKNADRAAVLSFLTQIGDKGA